MNAEEYLTTDELIERINQLPKVFAIRSDIYGIDIYADWEEYRDDDKDCRWFMTVDPDKDDLAFGFNSNDIVLGDISFRNLAILFGLVQQLRDTPVKERFPEKKYYLRWIDDKENKTFLGLHGKAKGASNKFWVTFSEPCSDAIFTESELEQLKKNNPLLAPAIDAMKEPVEGKTDDND